MKKISRILGLGDDSNIEIKTTTTDQRGRYNFVQIRPGTKDQLYFCFDTNASKLYVFAVFSQEMKVILPIYGSYAHGSIKLFGPSLVITLIQRRSTRFAPTLVIHRHAETDEPGPTSSTTTY